MRISLPIPALALGAALFCFGPPSLAQAACPDPPSDPTHFAPADTETLGSLDLDALTRHLPWADFESALRSDAEADDLARLADACDIGPESLDRLVLATNDSGGTMFMLLGERVGKRSTLACIEGQLAARAEGRREAQRRRSDDACRTQIVLSADTSLWPLDDSTLVIARGTWRDALEEAPRSSPPAALRRALRRVKRESDAWLVSRASSSALEGVETLSLSMDFAQGLILDAELHTDSANRAKALRVRVLAILDQVSRDIAGDGARPAGLDEVAIGTLRSTLALRVELTRPELRKLVTRVRERLSGAAVF